MRWAEGRVARAIEAVRPYRAAAAGRTVGAEVKTHMYEAWISAAWTAVIVGGVVTALPLLWIAWWRLADLAGGPFGRVSAGAPGRRYRDIV